jgi:hypothetical protein
VKGEALKAQVKEYKDSLKVKKGKSKDKEAEAEEAEVDDEEEVKVVKPKVTKTKKATPMMTLVEATTHFLMKEGTKKLGMPMWAKADCPGWEEGPIAERPHTHVLNTVETKDGKKKYMPVRV